MPSRSYTSPLWNIGAAAAGITTGPFVPAGDVWVVRDVTLSPPSIASPNRLGHIFLREAASGTVLWGVGSTDALGTVVYHCELRQALNEGNNLQLDAYSAGWSVAVTGYVFTTV